ncbi:MAG: Ig-like domain-containing protein [Bacteroidetes bacterium]|nr:Ig-like domain-containing protein [Bacteroidota bacterium]MBL7102832.1 Ig-like domain-containing protein [Bacteroidales bacterium]
MNWTKNIILICMVVLGFNIQAQPILLRIPDTTATIGDIIDIPIYVDSSLTGHNALSYQFKIYFNSTRLNFISVNVSGTLSQSWGTPASNAVGNYLYMANAGASTLSGTGKLLYMRFECITSGATYLNFDGGTANNYFNEGTPEMSFDNGYITIYALPTITVSPNSGLLSVGEQLQFYVSGGTAPYTWDVTDPAIANINASGLLTASAHGLTKVSCLDDNGIYDETDAFIEIRAMQLTIPDTSEWQGGTIEIPIYTSALNGLNILSGDISITFNGNILTSTGYNKTGTLLEGYSNIVLNNTVPGVLNIAFAGTTPLTGSGVLLYLQFDISPVNTGNTWISFSEALFNESLPAKTDNGYFTMITYSPIYITPNTWTMMAGESKQFVASGGVPPYNWSTTDPVVATIDGAGILTAHQSGVIQVVVTDNVGTVKSSGNVTVYDCYVTLPHVNASLGSQYDMPVLISSFPVGQTIYAVQGSISCESPELEILDLITSGTLTNGWTFAKSIVGNAITFAGAGTVPFTTSGAMFKIRFQLTPDLTSGENAWVNINDFMLNEGFPVPTLQNGSITGYGGIILNLTANLEGPFNGTDMNTDLNPWLIPNNQPYNTSPWNYGGGESFGAVPNGDVVDWVLVELRETAGSAATALPATMIARQAALILNNGDIVGTDGISNLVFGVAVFDNLYAIVWHRNHLGIMSSVPLVIGGGIYSYDFTTSASQAYLSGQKNLGGGEYGMFAGDADGNGDVHQDDINNVWTSDAGKNGYYPGDMDMNSNVNNQDKNDVWLPNNGTGGFVPE